MHIEKTLEILATQKLIAILRLNSADDTLWTATQLIEAGFRLIEITFTVPDAPRVIHALAQRFPEACIGAGTVLEINQARQALDAGARFLVSPITREPLIAFGCENHILTLPGCLTPTEIHHAHSLGAAAIKVFPANAMGGASYLKSIHDPLPDISLIPTGGIKQDQIADYLAAGALAVGVGGSLIPKDAVAARNTHVIRERAESYLETIKGSTSLVHWFRSCITS